MGGSAIAIIAPNDQWKIRNDIEVASVLGYESECNIGDTILMSSS